MNFCIYDARRRDELVYYDLLVMCAVGLHAEYVKDIEEVNDGVVLFFRGAIHNIFGYE